MLGKGGGYGNRLGDWVELKSLLAIARSAPSDSRNSTSITNEFIGWDHGDRTVIAYKKELRFINSRPIR